MHSFPVRGHSIRSHMYRPSSLFGSHHLEFFGAVEELVGVGLGDDSSLVGLLDEEFVTLLFSKVDSVLLGLEVEVGALHGVGG